jgi:hypothetical protein
MRKAIQRKVRGFCTLLSASIATAAFALFTNACSETLSGEEFNSAVLSKKFLYVASGACYSGGVAASTGSATIAKYDLTTGGLADLVIDYNTLGLGDMPAAIKNSPTTHFWSELKTRVAVE